MAVARVGDKWYDVGDLYGSKSFEGLTGKAYANKKKELDQQVLSGNYTEVDLNRGMLKGTNTPFRTDMIGAQPKSVIQTKPVNPVQAQAVQNAQSAPVQPTGLLAQPAQAGETVDGVFYKNGKSAFDNWFSNVGAGGITDQEKSNLAKALEQGKITKDQWYSAQGMMNPETSVGVRDFKDKDAIELNNQLPLGTYEKAPVNGTADDLYRWYHSVDPSEVSSWGYRDQALYHYLTAREIGSKNGDEGRKYYNDQQRRLAEQFGLPNQIDVGDGKLDNFYGQPDFTKNPWQDAIDNKNLIGGYYDLDGDLGKLGKVASAVGPVATIAAALAGQPWLAAAIAASSTGLSGGSTLESLAAGLKGYFAGTSLEGAELNDIQKALQLLGGAKEGSDNYQDVTKQFGPVYKPDGSVVPEDEQNTPISDIGYHIPQEILDAIKNAQGGGGNNGGTPSTPTPETPSGGDPSNGDNTTNSPFYKIDQNGDRWIMSPTGEWVKHDGEMVGNPTKPGIYDDVGNPIEDQGPIDPGFNWGDLWDLINGGSNPLDTTIPPIDVPDGTETPEDIVVGGGGQQGASAGTGGIGEGGTGGSGGGEDIVVGGGGGSGGGSGPGTGSGSGPGSGTGDGPGTGAGMLGGMLGASKADWEDFWYDVQFEPPEVQQQVIMQLNYLAEAIKASKESKK